MTDKKVPQAPAARNIYQRLQAVMTDVRGVAKRGHNRQGNYKYAGHEAVTEALRDAYVKHGIVRTASVVGHELVDKGTLVLMVEVSWVNVDDPESRHTVVIPAVQSSVQKNGGPSPVQVGMALSYAVKNAEFKTLALTGDDTPDVESDEVEHYDGGNASDAHYEDHPRDDANSLATAYLARFSDCRSEADIKALREEVRGNWAAVRGVPNFGEAMVSMIRKTSARLRGSERMMGED